MGMDVFGIAPTSDKGNYFRNNIWHWYPLLDVIARTNVLDEETLKGMGFNDGLGANADDAIRLADALDNLVRDMDDDFEFVTEEQHPLESAMINMIEEISEERIVRIGSTTVKNIKEFAHFCRDSGGFQVF